MKAASGDDRVKVGFRLQRDEDGYPPADSEYLWALPIKGDLYEIDNIPFFVRSVSWGDVIRAEMEDGELWFQEMVRASDHSTIRVVVFRGSLDDDAHDAAVGRLRKDLELIACSSERSHIPGLVAVDVPPHALAQAKDLLAEGERRGYWEYEEAALRKVD